MTKPIPGSIRDQLNSADTKIDRWTEEAKDRLRMQAEAVALAYPMPEIRIAQFLGETAAGLAQALRDNKDDPAAALAAVEGYKDWTVALAATVSRRARGKRPL